MTNEERAQKWAAKFADQVKRNAGKGLNKARLYAEGVVKFEASVKAPTRWVQPRNGGPAYPVATTPATPGAPLRVVSGRYYKSITSEMESELVALVGSNARAPERSIQTVWGVVETQGFNYPKYWEVENPVHTTFAPALERHLEALGKIVGGEVRAGVA
jgi:hypothetical protein